MSHPRGSLPAFLPFVVSMLLAGMGWQTSAKATSRLRTPPTSAPGAASRTPTCRASGRFAEAREKQGKIVWIFYSVPNHKTTCRFDSSQFEVWIWQGRYSTLTHSPIYPVYLVEPERGAELDLELQHDEIRELPDRTLFSGWFPAPGENSIRVRGR